MVKAKTNRYLIRSHFSYELTKIGQWNGIQEPQNKLNSKRTNKNAVNSSLPSSFDLIITVHRVALRNTSRKACTLEAVHADLGHAQQAENVLDSLPSLCTRYMKVPQSYTVIGTVTSENDRVMWTVSLA